MSPWLNCTIQRTRTVGVSAFEKFREIKTAEVRKAIAAKIARLAGE